MRARVNPKQAKDGLLNALSCKPGAECAKPIIAELVDMGVIPAARARDFAMKARYVDELRKPKVTPARALETICEEFKVSERTARDIVR